MKRLTRIVATLMLASAACTPALAADWIASEDKGLKVYNFREGTIRALMVCDPEELWDPPIYQFILEQSGKGFGNTTMTISKGEVTVALSVIGDAIVARDKDGWNTLIDMLAEPGPVTFDAAGKTLVIDSAKGLASPCRNE
jgi:hypothetical protein